jgi:hypothetical protein
MQVGIKLEQIGRLELKESLIVHIRVLKVEITRRRIPNTEHKSHIYPKESDEERFSGDKIAQIMKRKRFEIPQLII